MADRNLLATFAALLAVSAVLVPIADGHSYMTKPTSRVESANQAGCRGPDCPGPCDAPKSRPSVFHSASRGDQIRVEWPRNNHAGGFIRLAWTTFDQSDDPLAFQRGATQYSCHENGCRSDTSFLNGEDSNPQDGSRNACFTTITVPKNLPDGKATMQWQWFGGLTEPGRLADYKACADFQISGGQSGPYERPVFAGGDVSNPGRDVCKFSNTRKIGVCLNNPCRPPSNPEPPYSNEGIAAGRPIPESPLEMAWVSKIRGDITLETAANNAPGKELAPGGGAVNPPPVPLGPAGEPRNDGRCGANFGNAGCFSGECCSPFGFCGSTIDHCPNGLPTTPPFSIINNIRSDNRCGKANGGAVCAAGSCCSQYGFCGTTAAFCGATVPPVVVVPAPTPAPTSAVSAPPAPSSLCTAGASGVVCTPGNCCNTFQFCFNSAVLGTFTTNPGSICVDNSIVASTDARCLNKACMPLDSCASAADGFSCIGECTDDFQYCKNRIALGKYKTPDGLKCKSGGMVPAFTCLM